jgi:hypothetical protein
VPPSPPSGLDSLLDFLFMESLGLHLRFNEGHILCAYTVLNVVGGLSIVVQQTPGWPLTM